MEVAGWPTSDYVYIGTCVSLRFALGTAAALLVGRLLLSAAGSTRAARSSTAPLGTPPPGAFAQGAARATAKEREAGASKMRALGPPLTAREILAGVASGETSAEKVVAEMLDRARIAHEMTHCVVPCKPLAADGSVRGADNSSQRVLAGNPLADEALARAQELDACDKLRRGPLHGLPFSLKECFQLQGTDATAGLGKFKSQDSVVDHTPTRNAPLIDALLDAGAVPLAKTNVPQLMYSFECENPVYGRTSTPSSVHFIPGGSSGGEAALIASGGSVVGIGTDIGGSCRTPAHMSGCCGIKPARNRLSGIRKSPTLVHGSQTALASVPGVLGRHVDDIATLYGGVLTERGIKIMRAADPHQIVMPWNHEEYASTRKLRIGWYVDDGFMTPMPPCQRAVHTAVEILSAAGHHVEPFDLGVLNGTEGCGGGDVSIPTAMATFFSLISSVRASYMHLVPPFKLKLFRGDRSKFLCYVHTRSVCILTMSRPFGQGTAHIVKALAGEPLMPFIKKLVVMATLPLPNAVRWWLLPWISRHCLSSPFAAHMLENIGVKDTTAYYESLARQASLTDAFTAQMEKQSLDVLLTPAHVLPTCPHGATGDFVQSASYQYLANLLDWTAGVVPVIRMDAANLDKTDENWWASNVRHASDKQTLRPLRRAYEAVTATNLALPIGVQVMAKPYADEVVLRVMGEIECGSEFTKQQPAAGSRASPKVAQGFTWTA